jgi:uncharacterized membrane protein YGL010W
MAPLFVWMEVLFMLDYKPELFHRLESKINAEITKFKSRSTKEGDSAKGQKTKQKSQ